ncbi:transposase [Paucibacter sp. DJ2R-2]
MLAILKKEVAGVAVTETCRKHGICAATWYGWKSKYARARLLPIPRAPN